jgi:hypothetical protein
MYAVLSLPAPGVGGSGGGGSNLAAATAAALMPGWEGLRPAPPLDPSPRPQHMPPRRITANRGVRDALLGTSSAAPAESSSYAPSETGGGGDEERPPTPPAPAVDDGAGVGRRGSVAPAPTALEDR